MPRPGLLEIERYAATFLSCLAFARKRVQLSMSHNRTSVSQAGTPKQDMFGCRMLELFLISDARSHRRQMSEVAANSDIRYPRVHRSAIGACVTGENLVN